MCVSDGWFNPPAGVATKPAPGKEYPEFMLFDIEQDPEEDDDISGQTGVEKVLLDMKKKLADYKEMVDPTVTAPKIKAGNPRRHNDTWVSGWC